MKVCTLVYLYKPKEKKILLAMKKRGFGVGKLNGVGGKLEGAETMIENAIRETKEEIEVDLRAEDLYQVAALSFDFKGKQDWEQRADVFFVEAWEGEPVETEEMKPAWYDIDSLPYSEMWIDDIEWLPQVLEGKKIKAHFVYNESGDQILVKEVFVV